ncbi:FAD-binding protein [Roseibium limicola]|uniref:FAD-binding protein n=1 Tax=Roseibium limicola TaxID=2816037 RepID=A0A939EPR9_9HYPH|nr:FAD-binding protein [Roseibium limicola]MBO0345827.1 FAD-binding protein [Roseibium limicola]
MQETLRPTTVEEVRSAVEWAVSNETALAVRGHGSKDGLGRPVKATHAVDLTDLSGIVEYEPEELVLTVKTGTSIADVEALVTQHNQELSFEPMDLGPLLGRPAGQGSVGGVLATNLSGPRRLKAGAARDHILGMEAVSGRAEIFKAGGRVVKNVTGYDLPRAFCGSFGTLAIATTVTLKVNPRPESSATFCLRGLSEGVAVEALCRAMGSSAEVSGAAHLPDGAQVGEGPVTLLRLEGFPTSIDYRFAILHKLLGDLGTPERIGAERSEPLWRQVRDCEMISAGEAPVWKVSVAPAAGAIYVDALRKRFDVKVFYDWSGGLIWIRCEDGALHETEIRQGLAAVGGGHAMLIRARAQERLETPVFQPQPASLAALSARLKQQFDPVGILNPGRMVGSV